ncbi:hypothetical protein V2J09_012137 [Rumex salicifolius]
MKYYSIRPRLAVVILISLIISPSFLLGTFAEKTQASALDWLFKQKYFHNGVVFDDQQQLPAVDDDNEIHHRHAPKQARGSTSTKAGDRIDRLPGQPPVKFEQYGGYVTVDEFAGRALYYYFVESEYESHSKPLLLWLNGGPGCSSLGYGAMQELGPFRVESDGKTLYRNRFAWNKAANVLFLESPAGVGYSYSNRSSDYAKSGDKKTADDNLTFLLNWLERFPEYKKRDFFIAGESYAGHYVPQLAYNVVNHNKKLKEEEIVLCLKGIMMGNAVINDETDTKGMIDYFWTHAMISDESRNAIFKHCDFSPSAATQSETCAVAYTDASEELGNIDIYNIYAPVCFSSNLTTLPQTPNIGVVDPCSSTYVNAYLNLPQVQKALHANVTKLDHAWSSCSEILNWSDSPSSVTPILTKLMAGGLRVWIFSGDVDGRVPVTSSKYSINTMKPHVKTKWYPWVVKKEVGGYTQVYEGNLTFATVRGAGHTVPSYQPKRALRLITYFLSGKPLPLLTS